MLPAVNAETWLNTKGGGPLGLLLALCMGATADGRAPSVRVEPAHPARSFLRPVQVGTVPGTPARMYVLEQDGKLHFFPADPAATTTETVLDLGAEVLSPADDAFGEQGLLGVAFHPGFEKNGVLVVNFTRAPDGATVIARVRLPADPRARALERLLVVEQPYPNHNGGGVAFGPDGMLYVGLGDGGAGGDPQNFAQSGASLLGKFLRLDVDSPPTPPLGYAIPRDNPFLAPTDGIRDEVYALGLRNPWRFAFDRATGALWTGDVGQGAYEEVDVIERGQNYGWRCHEGFHLFATEPPCLALKARPPVAEYDHSQGGSITGGVVYRGQKLPWLQGAYLYADYLSGRIWAVRRGPNGTGQPLLLLETALHISSFGEGPDGEVYVTDHAMDGTRTRLHMLRP
ncbi:MAG: PQQ-dependent sugar dehydrogenase [Myxococcota bacterium]